MSDPGKHIYRIRISSTRYTSLNIPRCTVELNICGRLVSKTCAGESKINDTQPDVTKAK
jgi:hypothetical protein